MCQVAARPPVRCAPARAPLTAHVQIWYYARVHPPEKGAPHAAARMRLHPPRPDERRGTPAAAAPSEPGSPRCRLIASAAALFSVYTVLFTAAGYGFVVLFDRAEVCLTQRRTTLRPPLTAGPCAHCDGQRDLVPLVLGSVVPTVLVAVGFIPQIREFWLAKNR
jgi:hypothetical protein